MPAAPASSESPVRHDERADRRQANRAVAVSAVGLGATAVVELALAAATGSVALLGDALHNLSDVSTSVVVFIGFFISKRPPSSRYPYGYERAEDLAGLGIALVIWASAVVAGFESWRKLVEQTPTTNLGLGIGGALIGIVGNQLVATYKGRVGRRINSATLLADAKHSWLDMLSSVGALLGLVVVAAGFPWGDPVAGFAVTLFIGHVGWEVTSQMVHRLMDGVDPDDLAAATEAAEGVAGMQVATVRGRWMGRTLLVEVEGRLDAGLPLAHADQVGQQVEQAIHTALPAARRVHCDLHSA